MDRSNILVSQFQAVTAIMRTGLSSAGAIRIVMKLDKVESDGQMKVKALDVARAISELPRLRNTSGVFISERAMK